MVFKTSIQLRLRDTDQMGHVNNAVYLSYLELARVEWLNKFFPLERPEDYNFILARVEIDYKKPITLADKIEVSLWVSRIGTSSWGFDYQIVDKENDQNIYAQAKSVQVSYDYKTQKSIPLPNDLKVILQQTMNS